MPPPGAHGGDGPAVALALGFSPDEVLDLSHNMNPYAPDIAALVCRHLGALHAYPDPARGQELLAEVLDVPRERVILTNGGSEAIHVLARAIGGRPRSEPEFALHPRGSDGPIWRSNPHSPSGVLAAEGEHADVWDEAYYPLATGEWTARRAGFVAGSLTKTFTCPGLRLGYVLVDVDTDPEEIRRSQPHWSVNSLALACLPDMLASADLGGWSSQLALAREALKKVLIDRRLSLTSGQAPWVLVSGDAGRLDLRAVLAPHGVVVRDCASFGMAGTYRIAVPDAKGLRRLESALDRAAVDGSNPRS